MEIAHLTVVVPDYDAGIEFYCGRLGFDLLEDTPLGDGKRWVRVRPPGSTGTALLLGKADGEAQRARIGDQTGGRVFLFLETDDFARDHARFAAEGVRFAREPAGGAVRHRRRVRGRVRQPLGPDRAGLAVAVVARGRAGVDNLGHVAPAVGPRAVEVGEAVDLGEPSAGERLPVPAAPVRVVASAATARPV